MSVISLDPDDKPRCFGTRPGQALYAAYHDEEWGVPVYDDRLLFEMLILEGAQAGLSWETILKRREGYRAAYHNFDIPKVAAMSDDALDALCEETAIIRHRLKIFAARTNARAVMAIQKEYGSFSHYIWGFSDHCIVKNHWKEASEVPVTTALSDALSRDLKRRGCRFVGSTIIYAYLQAIGVVNDHVTSCWRYKK